MRKKTNKQSKLMHYISTPIRILKKARKFYMKGIEDCTGELDIGVAIACPAVQVSRLPKNFGTNSSKAAGCDNDEWRQLLPRRNAENEMRIGMHRQRLRQTSLVAYNLMEMNYRIGLRKMERIDEDKPCCFQEEDQIIMMANMLHPRSRSNDLNRRLVY